MLQLSLKHGLLESRTCSQWCFQCVSTNFPLYGRKPNTRKESNKNWALIETRFSQHQRPRPHSRRRDCWILVPLGRVTHGLRSTCPRVLNVPTRNNSTSNSNTQRRGGSCQRRILFLLSLACCPGKERREFLFLVGQKRKRARGKLPWTLEPWFQGGLHPDFISEMPAARQPGGSRRAGLVPRPAHPRTPTPTQAHFFPDAQRWFVTNVHIQLFASIHQRIRMQKLLGAELCPPTTDMLKPQTLCVRMSLLLGC